MASNFAKKVRFSSYFFMLMSFIWPFLMGTDEDHRLGDRFLSQDVFFAGDWFTRFSLKSYGLAVYSEKAEPYTHLPPGPEWIQAGIAWFRHLLNFERIPLFYWHSFWTVAISMVILYFVFRSILRRWGQSTQAVFENPIWMFFLSTVAVQIFSFHPINLGILVADATVVLFFIHFIYQKETVRSWPLLFGVFIFAFWMALQPLAFAWVWLVGFPFLYQFFSKKKSPFLSSLLIGLLALSVSLALKLAQNQLYFGNWEKTFNDAISILKTRQGVGVESGYHFVTHLMKLGWRSFFLYGAASPLLAYAWIGARKTLQSTEKILIVTCLSSAIVWQVVMRQHSFQHVFLLREALVPSMIVMVLFAQKGFIRAPTLFWLGHLQFWILWGAWLLPHSCLF